jgi:hypothetical protein
MVLVWSSHSIESPEVSKELTIGMKNQLLVIPYKIESIAPSGDWEYHLANSHWLDACGEEIKTANQRLAERLLPIFKRTPSVSEDGKSPGDHSAEEMREQITEMIWWAYRNGEPKLLDRKGIQLAIKQAGLPPEMFESAKSGVRRNKTEFIQAIGEALEDSEIEVTEEIALEDVRKECCISKKEAEALLRAKVGGLLIRGVEELKHDWILKACSAGKSEKLIGTVGSNDHGRPPESTRPSQAEQTESLGKKPVNPRQTQVREDLPLRNPVGTVPQVIPTQQESTKSTEKDSIMTQMMKMDGFTVHKVMNKFKISMRTANSYLAEHIACGRLERVGRGLSAEYVRKTKNKPYG